MEALSPGDGPSFLHRQRRPPMTAGMVGDTAASARRRLPSPRLRSQAGVLVGLRAVLIGGICAALLVPGMHQFSGEAMRLRVAVYGVGVLIVPVGVLAVRRGRAATGYPFAADLFLLVPFLFDLSGNSFHLYARVDNFDDAAHLVGVAALTACGAALLPRHLTALVRGGLAAGAGILVGVLIELVEWAAFTHPVSAGFSAYRDTVGDLAMDALGCMLACLLVALPRIRRRSA
jgi:hypothetical protein